MSEKIYIVKGMTCGGCVKSVTNALQHADPGAKVAVELASGRVTFDSALSDDAVRAVVEDAGFDFEGPAA